MKPLVWLCLCGYVVSFLVFPSVRKGRGLSDPQVTFPLRGLNLEKDPLLPVQAPLSLAMAEDPPVVLGGGGSCEVWVYFAGVVSAPCCRCCLPLETYYGGST